MLFTDVFKSTPDPRKRDKRERDESTVYAAKKINPFTDEDILDNIEAQQQQEILKRSFPHRSRQASTLGHKTSQSTKELKRAESNLIRPTAFEPNARLSMPMPTETQFAIEYENPRVPLPLIDQGRDYTDKLGKWVPCAWEGIRQMPNGTWIQYTSNVYQQDTRKKICGIKGEHIFSLPNSITIWSTPRLGMDTKNENTTEYTRTNCAKGRHLPLIDYGSNEHFAACNYCTCRGWALREGGPSQNRRFYVMPRALKSIQVEPYKVPENMVFN